jgi:Holliday junction resolvasome RuvABC DNA-binding subunit
MLTPDAATEAAVEQIKMDLRGLVHGVRGAKASERLIVALADYVQSFHAQAVAAWERDHGHEKCVSKADANAAIAMTQEFFRKELAQAVAAVEEAAGILADPDKRHWKSEWDKQRTRADAAEHRVRELEQAQQ